MDCINCFFNIQPIILHILDQATLILSSPIPSVVLSPRSLVVGATVSSAAPVAPRAPLGPLSSPLPSLVRPRALWLGADAASAAEMAPLDRAFSSLRRARWRIAAAPPGPAWLAGAAACRYRGGTSFSARVFGFDFVAASGFLRLRCCGCGCRPARGGVIPCIPRRAGVGCTMKSSPVCSDPGAVNPNFD